MIYIIDSILNKQLNKNNLLFIFENAIHKDENTYFPCI
jgi:hypothetical protein